jgi:hypothetical protein
MRPIYRLPIEILEQQFLVDFEVKITSIGYPAKGPSYASGGEPAEPPEYEINVLKLYLPLISENKLQLILPEWLKVRIAEYLENNDAVSDIVDEEIHYRNNPDPDEWHDRRKDNE